MRSIIYYINSLLFVRLLRFILRFIFDGILILIACVKFICRKKVKKGRLSKATNDRIIIEVSEILQKEDKNINGTAPLLIGYNPEEPNIKIRMYETPQESFIKEKYQK